MIEYLRKYTGLTIVIFVILFISFFFMDSSSMRNKGGGQAMYQIAGRTYDDREYNNLGKGSYRLASGLASSGEYSIFPFLMGISVGATSQEDAPEKFFVGRMLIRQAKEEFGVYPGEPEISAYLRTFRTFAGPDGKFSAETYHKFIQNYMGQFGMTEKDLRELASDILATKKITEIVGSGLTVDRDAVAKFLALQNQQISGALAKLELTPFEEKIEPKEEDIKKYWETISDSFMTESKRKFTYIVATPTTVEDTAPATPSETIAEAAASDEAKKAAAKKREEETAKRATEMADKRRAAQLDLDSRVADFLDKLVDHKGADFEELAKEYKFEVKTSEFFPKSAPPKELDIDQRASSRAGKAVDQLFQIEVTSDPLSKISQGIPVGENQWIVARLDEEEKSRAKTYPEARDEARAQYIAEKAAEALKTAANEDVTKIKALLAAGKSFADAAKEVGIPETKEFSHVASAYRPDGANEPQNLFEAARAIDPGSLAEPIIESDRAFLLYVAKRELVKDPALTAKIDAEVTSRTTNNETIAFTAWMSRQIEDAKVQALFQR
jgi:hypothetical protein